MKKFSLAFAVVILITLATTSKAQQATANFFMESAISGDIATATKSDVDKAIVNPKAVRHFEKKFKGVSNAQWMTLKDGFMARFKSNDITERVFYNFNGTLAGTLKGYTSDKMADEILRMVKDSYNGYAITYVDEAEIVKVPGITAYIVHLQGNQDLKVVRFCDDEMDVIFDSEKKTTVPSRF